MSGHSVTKRLAIIAVVAAVYFGSAQIGLSLASAHRNVSLIWPSTGIALAAVLLLGYWVWPAITLGAFLATAATGVTLFTAGGIAGGNTLEALGGAFLVRRLIGRRNPLDQAQDVFIFVGSAVLLSTMVSATIGAASLCLGMVASWSDYGQLWSAWWLGDAAGALVVAPAVLAWSARRTIAREPRQVAEVALLLVLLTLVSYSVFAGWISVGVTNLPLAYLPVPFLIWAAVRFHQRTTTTAILLSSGIAIWGTAHGLGPFARGATLNESLILLHTFVGTTAVMSLVMAAVNTQRRQAEETQQASQEQYKLLVEQANDIIYRTDVKGCFTYVNPTVTRFKGYAQEELIGRNFTEFIRLDSREAVRRQLMRQFVQKTPSIYQEFPAITKGGGEIWIGQNVQPLIENGQVVGFQAVAMDITKRKRAEQALKESEERYRGLVDLSPSGIFVYCEGKTVYVNRAACRILGADSPEQILGQPTLHFIHPDCHAAIIENARALLSDEGTVRRAERKYLKVDRTVIDVQVEAAPIIWNGKPAIQGMFSDITEHKRIEQNLRESEELFSKAFRSSPHPVVLTEVETGRCLEANDAALTLFGFQREEVIGRTTLEFGMWPTPEDRARFFALFHEKKFIRDHELTLRTRHGDLRQCLISCEPVELGGVRCLVTVGTDITERKKAEVALRGTTEHLRALIQTSPLAIINLDPDSNIMSWNRAAEDMLGWSESEVLGKPLPYIPAEKEAEADALWDKAMQGSGLNGIEIRRVKKDGTPIDLEVWSRTLRDAGGAHISSLGILSDITERKEMEQTLQASENRFRTLTSFAPVGIFFADSQGNCLLVNERWTELAGLTSEEAKGQGWVQALHPEDRERVRQEWYAAAQARREFHSEYRFQTRDGTVNWLVGRAMVLRNSEGTVTGYIGSVTDITERKKAEEALEASEKRLRTILEAEPECVKVTTEDGILLDMNAAGLAMIEADSLKQVRGQSVLPIIAPAYRDAFADFNRRVYRGEPGTMQFEIIGFKGRRLWMDTHAVPLCNEHNVTIGVLAITRDVTERKREENIMQALLEGTASVTGEQFFPALVRALASALGVRHAIVTELLDDEQPRLRMLAIWMGDRLGNPTEYDLIRTPCEKVIKLGAAYYQHSVQKLFPEDKDLVALGAVSYLGIALADSSGKTSGHLCIVDDKPLPDEHHIAPLLKVFASRAAAELESKQAEEALRERAGLSTFAAEVSLVLNSETSTDEMLHYCADAAVCHLGVALARIWIVEPGDLCEECHKAAWCTNRTRCLHLSASAGLSSNLNGEYRRVPLGALKIGRIAQGTGIMVTNDVLDDERLPNKDWLRENGLQSFAGFPLLIEGEVFGVMAVFARVPLSGATLQTLESVCNGIAATIARKRGTERLRESEERFRRIFEDAPIGVATVGRDYRFTRVNRIFCDMLGYTKDELTGKIFSDITHPEDKELGLDLVKQLFSGTINSFELEKRYLRKDQSVMQVHLTITGIRDKDGGHLYNIAMIEDITKRKRAEQGLRERSRQQAIEAELSLLAVTVPDFPSLLGTAVKLVSNALEVNYCEVLELLPNGTDLRLCASAGWRGDRSGQVRAVETGSLAHAALQSGKPAVRTLLDDTPFSGPPWLRERKAVGGMSVTIHGKDTPWGILGVYTAGTRDFSRDDINFLQTVSSILATAIERTHAEGVLRNANLALRTLSRQLLQVQEDDRRAIARDLHDEIGQSLTAIKLNVERAQRTPDRAVRDRIMKDCIQITDGVLNQVRNLSLDLHPSILDDLGLGYALKWHADRQAERAGLKIMVAADPSLPRLSRDIELGCFRIVQEALTNIVRHAKASQASVTLKRGTASVEISIRDNGIGFVVDAASPTAHGTSIGLTSMQERARLLDGEVRIKSVLGQGTVVVATLPLASSAETPTTEVSRS